MLVRSRQAIQDDRLLDEQALVRRAYEGDREAFAELCERYLPVVYRRLSVLLPPEAVEDVTQEVFVAALVGLKHYRGDASFRTWLSGIARHKAADYYRTRLRRGGAMVLEVDDDRVSGQTDEQSGVRLALMELPAHYQEVLLLRFAEDMAFQDIATTLGLSLEATKSRYRRAVSAFAKAYEGR